MRSRLLTLRIPYNLFTQRAQQEFDDFSKWIKMVKPGQGSNSYRLNGAGEMIVFSAADFEDFLEPRPDLAPIMESELKADVTLLAQNRWPFRIHATYDESIARFLNVFEEVNREVPFDGLRWFFDHAETISEGNLDRVKALNGGIAIHLLEEARSRGRRFYNFAYLALSLVSDIAPWEFLRGNARERLHSDLQEALAAEGEASRVVSFKGMMAFLKERLLRDELLPREFKEVMQAALQDFSRHAWAEEQVNEFLAQVLKNPEELLSPALLKALRQELSPS